MRPFPGDDAFLGRPRAGPDNEQASSIHTPPAAQTSYFLTDEASVDASLEQSLSAFQRPRDPRKSHAAEGPGIGGTSLPPGSPPIDALDNTRPPSSSSSLPSMASGVTDEKGDAQGRRQQHGDALPTLSASLAQSPMPGTYVSSAGDALSQAMTPILASGLPSSCALSNASSRRSSTIGSLSELSHEGMSVDADVDSAADGEQQLSSMMDSGSAPQLVMPSIKMPSRRPFTDEGKALGRLKVLIAGGSGIGKTSLIKAIVQSCEHIVHVDPIAAAAQGSPTVPAGLKSRRPSRASKPDTGTTQITEVYASTKPYPEWWSDLDDFPVLRRRRKSLGGTVLDRNICFVDTPGYGRGSSPMEAIKPVVQYVESQLQRVSSNALSDADLLGMLGGDGGSQVDVVFYLIHGQLKPVDLELLRQIAPLTNIIPLLARADSLSPEQIEQRKGQVNSQLLQAGIKPFDFGTTTASLTGASGAYVPFAISSATGSDNDTMDASLLMSPDYVQPLVSTELSALVERVFCHNGASWLRHSAARKYLQWRSSEISSKPQALYRPLSLPLSLAAPTIGPEGATSAFALAQIADHTQREERLAQIRLANWAADLQKSLANERSRYERLARSERAIWLTERLNECVQDGTLVPMPSHARGSSGESRSISRGRDNNGKMMRQRRMQGGSVGARGNNKTLHHQDPLGLLEMTADLKAKGWVALELLGGIGVVGGLVLWVSRQYCHFQIYEWAIDEWGKFWYGER